uniref:Uncharacterized protein n=1 Tax=Triticum urartu TaxID=4572 RepID=A0A8R7QA05_TRIUA
MMPSHGFLNHQPFVFVSLENNLLLLDIVLRGLGPTQCRCTPARLHAPRRASY